VDQDANSPPDKVQRVRAAAIDARKMRRRVGEPFVRAQPTSVPPCVALCIAAAPALGADGERILDFAHQFHCQDRNGEGHDDEVGDNNRAASYPDAIEGPIST
jgi:hypothetical protein